MFKLPAKFMDAGPFQSASIVAQLIASMNHEVYMVGGSVRDAILDQIPKDIDLTTDMLPEDMMKLDGWSTCGITVHCLPIGIDHGTVVFMVNDGETSERVEVTTMRKDIKCDGRHASVKFSKDIEEDLARRDFTINAMAIKLGTTAGTHSNLIDPFNGKIDLKQGMLRCVGNPEERFQEDFLRIVRGCRFTAYPGIHFIEDDTFNAMRDLVASVSKISVERRREELLKMMKTENPGKALKLALEVGLLPWLCPPLVYCLDVDGGPYHDEDVFSHLCDACEWLPADRPMLRLAGLLHDCGKPESTEVRGGALTFHNHEVLGSRIAYKFAMDYKFSRDEAEYLSKMVRHHMFHFSIDDPEVCCPSCKWKKKLSKIPKTKV